MPRGLFFTNFLKIARKTSGGVQRLFGLETCKKWEKRPWANILPFGRIELRRKAKGALGPRPPRFLKGGFRPKGPRGPPAAGPGFQRARRPG